MLNLINSAYQNKIQNFINLGSSCIYPKKAKQPIKENYLLSSSLEKTNEAYVPIQKLLDLRLVIFTINNMESFSPNINSINCSL